MPSYHVSHQRESHAAALGVSALFVKSVCMKSNFSLDQVHEPVVEPVMFRRTRVPHF